MKRVAQLALITAAATIFALGISRTAWHRGIENAYYDWWHVSGCSPRL